MKPAEFVKLHLKTASLRAFKPVSPIDQTFSFIDARVLTSLRPVIPKIRFPWIVFATAFVVYALSLSHGITFDTLGLTSQLAGWDWQPMSGRPMLWLLTLPFRILPAGWMAVTVNLFSAVCAALTLGLLARSVDLLPWRRLAGTATGWPAKIPVLLACAVCGLEFNFWREATAGTGELVDVLLFSATLCCLLEFHRSRESRWLDGAALVWGLTMANNPFMLLFLPLFVIILIWLKIVAGFRR